MNSNVSGSGADEDVKKMSESWTKAGNRECFEKLEKRSLSLLSLLSQLSLSHSLSLDTQ